MSEKEKETEEAEMEAEAEAEKEEIVEHWSHEHPLTLLETRRGDNCYGCEQHFSSGEQAYGCSNKGCGYGKLLHEECAEMARNIQHPLHHPQHILIQRHEPDLYRCEICRRGIFSIGYKCTSSGCEFEMHMRCAQGDGGMMDAAVDDAAAAEDEQRRSIIHHPSHPKHELKLFKRRCSFKCDACGTTRTGTSYTCTIDACQFWIHQKCASLPQTIQREDHHHPLSLSFCFPLEYLIYDYKCDACNKYLLPKYWIYHCQICRYILHIKCAFKKSPHTTANNANASNGKDMIYLPSNEVSEELITPFVMRQGGTISPIIPGEDEMVNVKYKFLHHQHQLALVSSSHDDQDQEEEDDVYGKRSGELICDGCITPIFEKKDYYYMSCSREHCKYNLHMACFHLPPHLRSLPLHPLQDGHELVLQSPDPILKFNEWCCSVCNHWSNGLFYACTKCDDFKVDIKCAAMPDTIYHAAHPLHPLNLLSEEDRTRRSYRIYCDAGCGVNTRFGMCYACDRCDFIVHAECVMLPASIRSCRWDKHHPLPLTYDANLNHPGDFYCDECETQMNPKSWMYHCRHCDLSFHPTCFPATSGYDKNIKFGHEYVINAAAPQPHPHPLTFQLLTTKRRCDLCHQSRHECRGFHCASCNFFICLMDCGQEMLQDGHMQAVD